jgi:hypothetical protein
MNWVNPFALKGMRIKTKGYKDSFPLDQTKMIRYQNGTWSEISGLMKARERFEEEGRGRRCRPRCVWGIGVGVPAPRATGILGRWTGSSRSASAASSNATAR